MTLANQSDQHHLVSSGIEKNGDDKLDTKMTKLSGNELGRRIIELVEYYLSDENVLKDQFLLKHVRRNKEGYVSVKLITSYRKVKRLTKDWKIVADNLKQSTKLELNSEGDRVRRKLPLPACEDCSPSTSVIAYKFPFEKPTVDKVWFLFSSCGDIFLIQILRPGYSVPAGVRKLFRKNPEIATQTCALIEFEDENSAQAARDVKEVKVVPLAEICKDSIKRDKKKITKQSHSENSSRLDSEKYSSSVSSGYLSSSPSRHSFYGEFRNGSQTSRIFNGLAPSINDNRNYRENFRHNAQLLCVIRQPKGPDNTKGFKDPRRTRLPVT